MYYNWIPEKTTLNLWLYFKDASNKMGVEGLEPSRPIDQQILSLLCLPFHHTPTIFKATPRFELGIEDLQSTALPLGHIASFHKKSDDYKYSQNYE